MLDYAATINQIAAHRLKKTAETLAEYTEDEFEVAVRAALVATEKLSDRDALVQLAALESVLRVAKVMSESGAWADTNKLSFPQMTGALSAEAMTAWASRSAQTLTGTPGDGATNATAFSANTPAVKSDSATSAAVKDVWGFGDFNAQKHQ